VALGAIAVFASGVAAVAAAATAPAHATDSLPSLTYGPMGFYCYANADYSGATRYHLTNVYIDEWDLPSDAQSTPVTREAIRYRYHVSRQHWDGSQYLAEGDWEGFWGGPDQYVPISNSYSTPNGVCKNITGSDFGIRAGWALS
jgi:hypothetical protein